MLHWAPGARPHEWHMPLFGTGGGAREWFVVTIEGSNEMQLAIRPAVRDDPIHANATGSLGDPDVELRSWLPLYCWCSSASTCIDTFRNLLVPPCRSLDPNRSPQQRLQYFGRMGAEGVQSYGKGCRDQARRVTSRLVVGSAIAGVTVNAPNDGSLYVSFSGHPLPSSVLVCIPHGRQPASGLRLPVGIGAAHAAARAPLWPMRDTFPLRLFSHGFIGSRCRRLFFAISCSRLRVCRGRTFHGGPEYPRVCSSTTRRLVYF